MGVFKNNTLTVFEHESFKFNLDNKEQKDFYLAIEQYFGEGKPYFSLTYKGVKFNEYVGVIQIGKYTIKVLPKTDNSDFNKWDERLFEMLKTIWGFEVKSTSDSNLKIKPNSILELYFSLFLNELEYLIRLGLIKKYQQKEGNQYALKGALQFNKHITQNLTHQERFYVRYTCYNYEHKIHQILYKTIGVIDSLSNHSHLKSAIGRLKLDFPEMKNIAVTESTFNTIVFDRKNEPYRKALSIAKMILLNYHPNLQGGNNNVLALMFDMNLLWEKFVYITLKRNLKDWIVRDQVSKDFWKSDAGKFSRLKADIIIKKEDQSFVLDTKWKNIGDKNPSPEDLRQMYVYNEYYGAHRACLIYPGIAHSNSTGDYQPKDGVANLLKASCSILQIAVEDDFNHWQTTISQSIKQWIEDDKTRLKEAFL